MTGPDDEHAAHLAEVGLRIKAWRVRRRIRQDVLADRASVSRVTLGSIERGEHAATLTTYLKVARALAVDLGDLVTERDAQWV